MTPFASAIAACGLSIDDAAVVLGQSRFTVLKKSAGSRGMTPSDARVLSGIWHRIRQGDVQGLPDGAKTMSATMRILRGVDTIQPAKTGRPAKAKEASHA